MQHQQQPFDVMLAYFVYPSGYLATIVGDHLRIPVVCSCRGNDISKDLFIDPATLATVLQHSTQLIFVSDSLLHMADTLVPCRAKATIVANAVDDTLFTPAAIAAQHGNRTVVLGTSGLMRWKKGIDLFLPLIRDLCASHDVRILIAGYGLDETVEQQMADFLTSHHLRERVDILGPLPHEHMVGALHRMDIYITTSYQEGMPNGVLEAMACALPVVATAADGIPRLVEDGVTGFLCPMGDLATLTVRCRTLINQPDLRRRMGQAGRQRVQQDFHPDREAQAVEDVLRRACEA
jgi:glycosyltransferase involved in cell wall biosynthesis